LAIGQVVEKADVTGREATLAAGRVATAVAASSRRNPTIRAVLLFTLVLLVVLAVIALVLVDLALPGPGLLRVTSSPGLPTQILLDGQIADSRGLNWLKLAPGNHTVCFSHVEGWTEPGCQTVTVTKGDTTTLTGQFIQRGTLRIVTSPALPSQITVDGNPTDDWSTWTDIPTGSHKVCFGAVVGYDPPPCQNASVTAGKAMTITGLFKAHRSALGQSGLGRLTVATSPLVPSQILITPSGASPYIADSWALHDLELTPGPYVVSFSHIQGYAEPGAQMVSITSGITTSVTGVFTRRGSLKVSTSPAAAGTITVDGVPRNDWGMSTEFPIGSHRVCFGQAAGFATPPACQTATVRPGEDTVLTGIYR
jgi:hypothetical protein